MKTDASSTTKKSKKEQAEQIAAGQALVGFFMEYLQTWSKEQLAELRRRNPSLCLPIHNQGYEIGRFTIISLRNKNWRVVEQDSNKQPLDFHNKVAAILYCVYMIKNELNKAKELAVLDNSVSKLSIDIEFYQHGHKTALNKKDWFKVDLYVTRIREARIALTEAQSLLQKTLSAAKYNKVWDRKP